LATNNTPEWVDGKKINEVLFCEDFLREYPMVSMNGTFFTVDGLVSDENLLKKKIYDFLKPYVSTGLPKKVSNLLEVLRMECCTEDLPLQTDRIHVENGTLFLDGAFTSEKEFCRNRLTVSYDPNAPEPVAWKAFLSQLLYPEDIPALQEYLRNRRILPMIEIPYWEKYMLTLREAAEYFHIGEKKMRQIVDENMDANFILTSGNRVMVKRKLFEEYLNQATVI